MALVKSALWENYSYDSETGKLFRDGSSIGARKGEVGSMNGHGYLCFGHRYKSYRCNIVAYEIFHNKKVPKGMVVDHLDGDKLNNQIGNLSLTTYRGNNCNKKIHREGKLFGIYFDKQHSKFRARITTNGVTRHLGLFADPLDAHNAYIQAINGE